VVGIGRRRSAGDRADCTPSYRARVPGTGGRRGGTDQGAEGLGVADGVGVAVVVSGLWPERWCDRDTSPGEDRPGSREGGDGFHRWCRERSVPESRGGRPYRIVSAED